MTNKTNRSYIVKRIEKGKPDYTTYFPCTASQVDVVGWCEADGYKVIECKGTEMPDDKDFIGTITVTVEPKNQPAETCPKCPRPVTSTYQSGNKKFYNHGEGGKIGRQPNQQFDMTFDYCTVEIDKRKCQHTDENGKQCSGFQFYRSNAAPPNAHARYARKNEDESLSLAPRRPGWECPECGNFDER
jgi:hypothetical protein